MPLLQLLLICSAVAWHMSAGAAAVLDSNFTSAPQCHPPPWSVPGPSLTLDRLLATKGADRLIKAGKAAEAVRRLRRALSPAAAASVDRWKAAPHAALRAALGRALMASEPDKPANAFAQFVAAKRLELGENPLHVFLPNDAAECVLKRRPPPPASCAAFKCSIVSNVAEMFNAAEYELYAYARKYDGTIWPKHTMLDCVQ